LVQTRAYCFPRGLGVSCSPFSPGRLSKIGGKKLPPLTVGVEHISEQPLPSTLASPKVHYSSLFQSDSVRALTCRAETTDTSDRSSSRWTLFELVSNAHTDMLVTRQRTAPQERGNDNEVQINRLNPCCHFAGCQLGQRRGFSRQETGKGSQDGSGNSG
jgi:hypothetical protein